MFMFICCLKLIIRFVLIEESLGLRFEGDCLIIAHLLNVDNQKIVLPKLFFFFFMEMQF